MAHRTLKYPTVLFDWGDTVMRDDPASILPMVEWSAVEIIEGIVEVLEYLRSSRRRIVLATSAAISDDKQIRAALARVGLDEYFSCIYCFKDTQLTKSQAFYRHTLNDLGIPASEALMVGDSFEMDVRDANALGIFAVWFNPRSTESRRSNLHITVHSMNELRKFLELLD